MSYKEEVLSYFKNKALAYDDVDKQVYWRLSDQLLWKLLVDAAISKLPENFSFLDAGGGTGRWSKRILSSYQHATGEIRDISPAMLDEARKKQSQMNPSRWKIVEGSIDNLNDIPDGSFNLVFNFHNVIGFLPDPSASLREMARVLAPDGFLITVAPNSYHMAFFNIFLGKTTRAKEALFKQQGRFTDEMPLIKAFTPNSLTMLYDKAGLVQTHVYGFPKLIYPGYQETQLHGSTASITSILEGATNYDEILNMETEILFDESAASRGNNLFAIGRK